MVGDRLHRVALAAVMAFACLAAVAQDAGRGQEQKPCVETMPGMQMCPNPGGAAERQDAEMKMGGAQAMKMDDGPMANMHPINFLQEIQHHGSSGTSAEPDSTPVPMLMTMRGEWMLMFHANVFVTGLQQTGPRGGDKFFSTNWLMPMAERRLGPGQLTLRGMFSLEPATVTKREYPLLFQQGETAFGKPIVDGQHPHDFLMELAALYDVRLGERTLVSFYAAPVGDPAIGPTAYPHRASAAENPVGSLGHHQQDSTHIADDVVTVGVTHRMARVEASGFHGREPDEYRWNLDSGAVDSWSTRLTLQPGRNWSGQYSYARIKSPEELFPGEDQARTTASVMYNRPFRDGNWASTVLWGRTRSLSDDAKENSYLLESLVRFRKKNYAWTRVENAGRSNELLRALPAGAREEPLRHVQAYTFGYDRDVDVLPRVRTAIGAQMTAYGVPEVLRPVYGGRPFGVAVFLRVRVDQGR